MSAANIGHVPRIAERAVLVAGWARVPGKTHTAARGWGELVDAFADAVSTACAMAGALSIRHRRTKILTCHSPDAAIGANTCPAIALAAARAYEAALANGARHLAANAVVVPLITPITGLPGVESKQLRLVALALSKRGVTDPTPTANFPGNVRSAALQLSSNKKRHC